MREQKARTKLPLRVAAMFVAGGGVSTLLGWLIGSPLLKSVVPGLTAMNPATALLFILTALILILHSLDGRSRPLTLLRVCLPGVVLIASLLTLLGNYFGWHVGVDRILFAEALGENRMAPNTAAYFMCAGLALLALEKGSASHWLGQILGLLVFGGSFVGLLGYGYGAVNLYGIGNYAPMALNTALLFLGAAAGILCICVERGTLGFITDSGLGSAMARRLFPAALVIPCILGFLRIWGQRSELYDTEFGAALMVVGTVALLLAAVAFTASALNRIDAQRREAMDALRRSADEIRDLYNNAPCGYHSLDSNGVIVAMNETELNWLGYRREEVEGKLPFSALLSPGSSAAFAATFAAFEGTGRLADLEFDLVRKDGTVIPVTITAVASLDAEGKHAASRYAVSDATERRRAEDAIRRANESLEQRVEERTADLADANRDLQQKNQENEMFVYSVSHDLRSPLVNLQGFSKELDVAAADLKALLTEDSVPDSVRKKASELLDGDVQQSLRFIQVAVVRLGNIIDALLRLSRVGRVEYQPKLTDVHAVVVGVVESMGSALYDADVTICLGDLPPCYGDATALEQLFANLIGNAVKYRDPARACRIEIGAENAIGGADRGTRRYYVRDNGLGIPAAHQEKIFQAFKRAHPGVAPGEGMGLAIVRRIVERHGGTAWVESQEKQGSTFFVTLPAQASSRIFKKQESDAQEGDTGHGSRTDGDLIGGRR